MRELVDLVDRQGEIQLYGVPREEAEQHNGLYLQIVVAVIVNSRNQLLVHERAQSKVVNGGDVDHVCGAIVSGESPEEAAVREASEEVGVEPYALKPVRAGVNQYGRYCFLLLGESDTPPKPNPTEAAWAGYQYLDELQAQQESGALTFVDGFFEDAQAALAARTRN